jgi:hypothetical protein
MKWNEDWDLTRRRFDAFWAHEIIDRACLQLYAPRHDVAPFPRPAGSPGDHWCDPAAFYAGNAAGFRHTHYLAEAFPVVYSSYGGLAAMQGCEQIFDDDTVWTRPCLRTLDGLAIQIDPANPILQRMIAIIEHAARHGQGQCLVSFPADMGNRGDTLAKMRGYPELCIDLADDPARVAALEQQVFACWLQLYDLFYSLTRPYMDGTCTQWLPIWSRGRSVLVEADFIALISPRHLREVYLPTILAMIRSAERSIFHLDGPDAARHVDLLLDIPELDGIQWEPGVAAQSATYWLPLLQKIQSRGKLLWARCRPDEAAAMLANLSPRGLILSVPCDSLETAHGIIRLAEKSAAQRR